MDEVDEGSRDCRTHRGERTRAVAWLVMIGLASVGIVLVVLLGLLWFELPPDLPGWRTSNARARGCAQGQPVSQQRMPA